MRTVNVMSRTNTVGRHCLISFKIQKVQLSLFLIRQTRFIPKELLSGFLHNLRQSPVKAKGMNQSYAFFGKTMELHSQVLRYYYDPNLVSMVFYHLFYSLP